MRAFQILDLMALPLATAMPATTYHNTGEQFVGLAHRSTLMDDSQFQFLPFNLTNLGMECARPIVAVMYDCQLRCK